MPNKSDNRTLPERSPHSQQYRGSDEVKDPGRGQQIMQAHMHQQQLCALFAHVNANGTLAHFSIFQISGLHAQNSGAETTG